MGRNARGKGPARTLLILGTSASLAACERGGISSAEMEVAATERMRAVDGLAANVPLEATVWIGSSDDAGETILCGTVSDRTPGSSVAPKRFAATGDPIRWLIFEDAHGPMVHSEPDKFREWGQLCAAGQRD